MAARTSSYPPARRRLDREQRGDLEHVVLDHVADRADAVVEASAALDAEALAHRDLDAFDLGAVPERLEEGVGEAEVEEVLHRLLAEVVVDAEDRLLGEDVVQRPVERTGGGEIVSERFLDHDARSRGATRSGQMVDDGREERRRNREIVERPACVTELAAQRGERGRVPVVAVDVAEQGGQSGEDGFVNRPVSEDAVAGPRPQDVDTPARLGDADHGDVEPIVSCECVQRREDLLVGEVAGRAVEDDRIGAGSVHRADSARRLGGSRVPPMSPARIMAVIAR